MPRGHARAANVTIDSGSFSSAALSKAGHDLVREALSETSASTVPVAVEDYEVKYCQATKGGKTPECRVHVTSTGGTSMALRLCDKVDGEGTVVPVKDAADALKTAREFCGCARNKATSVRAKCARKIGGRPLSGVRSNTATAADIKVGAVFYMDGRPFTVATAHVKDISAFDRLTPHAYVRPAPNDPYSRDGGWYPLYSLYKNQQDSLIPGRQ